MTNSGSKQQQHKYMADMYEYILVRRAAAYSIILIYQVQVPCCETAHGVYVTKRETTVMTAHRAAAAAAGLCMYIKLTSRLLRRHLNHHRTYFCTGTRRRGMSHQKKTKRHHHPGFEPRTSRSEGQQPSCSPTEVIT